MERQYQILIVDDDDAVLSNYQNYFTKQGFTVKVAHNGIERLEKLRCTSQTVVLIHISRGEKSVNNYIISTCLHTTRSSLLTSTRRF